MINTIYRNKSWLQSIYENDGWSQNEIAKFCHTSQTTIYKWLKKHNIPSRDMIESHTGSRNGAWVESPVKDYDWMYKKYIKEKKTLREVAKDGNVSLRTVARWLKEHGISARHGSNAIIKSRAGKNNSAWTGGSFCDNCHRPNSYNSKRCQLCHFNFLREAPINNANYKGYSSFTQLLRGYTREHWAPLVFKRDYYTCRECGDDKGGNLNAHHIVPFATIRDQIIMENINFDLDDINDETELIKIARADYRINDIDNGITLCEDCHIGEHKRIKYHKDDLIYNYYADVIEVKDADTITADIDLGFGMKKREDVRLYGLNAPEIQKTDPNYELAIKGKDIMAYLCMPGRRIILRTFKPGKYGRLLAFLILDSGILNKFLVSKKLAVETYY